jgi:signal peptidase I
VRMLSCISNAIRSHRYLVALLGITQCLAGPVWIPTESMVPTLLVGDVLFANRLAYGFHLPLLSTAEVVRWSTPERGDVIVFNAPPTISNFETLFIKRVAAVAGDTIEVRDQRIILNGKPLTYTQVSGNGALEINGRSTHKVHLASNSFADFGPMVVPAGHVFVLGDNRNNSADSRVWGPLALERVRGKAHIRLGGVIPSNFRGPGPL